MNDQRILIDLLNKRFDDMQAIIFLLKADMLRETESLTKSHEDHEKSDDLRHEAVQVRLMSLDKIKWSMAGAASLAVLLAKVIDYFLTA